MSNTLDPTTVICPDGQTRAWHRSPSTSLRGFVYVDRTRVYGNIARSAVDQPFTFTPDPRLNGATAIQPATASA